MDMGFGVELITGEQRCRENTDVFRHKGEVVSPLHNIDHL
jgi:hypothetical protein